VNAKGADFAALRAALPGRVVLPGESDYDRARRVWNGMVDRKPAAIVYCTSAGDVARSLECARARGLPLAVRAGGHNIAGSSVRDGGLVIDLSRMKAIRVDAERAIALAQAGLTLGEFDAGTQAHRLATTMGVNSDTGIAGLTLGGGFGKLGRKHGLSCDNLLSAQMVKTDGVQVTANATEHPDLFWALRGGGGNFGIVTSFTFRLHPLGPTMLRARLVYAASQLRPALNACQELAASSPDEVSADAALAFAPSGERVLGLTLCFAGAPVEGAAVLERLLRPLRAKARASEEHIEAPTYLDIQRAGDATFPRGLRYYWKAQFLRQLPLEASDALLEAFARAPSQRSLLVLQHVGGAIARVAPSATAYAHRDALYDCFPIGIWRSPANDEANIAWVRTLWHLLEPYSTGGVYVNNLGEEGEARVRAAYGDNYARLAAVKRAYDPENLLQGNQNIVPVAA
jgi:FAD/FMN-containing dehydrogenase